MIRLVDMRQAEIVGVSFALWDTVVDRFIEDEDGDQAWEDYGELVDKMPIGWAKSEQGQRVWRLCPCWVIEST
jgi:hypothetical protein